MAIQITEYDSRQLSNKEKAEIGKTVRSFLLDWNEISDKYRVFRSMWYEADGPPNPSIRVAYRQAFEQDFSDLTTDEILMHESAFEASEQVSYSAPALEVVLRLAFNAELSDMSNMHSNFINSITLSLVSLSRSGTKGFLNYLDRLSSDIENMEPQEEI